MRTKTKTKPVPRKIVDDASPWPPPPIEELRAEPKPGQKPSKLVELFPPVSELPAKPSALSLTALLTKCFQFDADADEESRQLLLDTFEYWDRPGHERLYDFNVVMASQALHSLGVHVGVDSLEVKKFLELMNLFAEAVTGWGYGGLREQLIARLLREGSRDMKFDDVLAIFTQEFSEHHSELGVARQVLNDCPEEVADAIQKATEALEKRRKVRRWRLGDGPS